MRHHSGSQDIPLIRYVALWLAIACILALLDSVEAFMQPAPASAATERRAAAPQGVAANGIGPVAGDAPTDAAGLAAEQVLQAH